MIQTSNNTNNPKAQSKINFAYVSKKEAIKRRELNDGKLMIFVFYIISRK